VRAAASLLQTSPDGADPVEEGEAVRVPDGVPDREGVKGGTVGDGERGTECRELLGRGPAGLASLALQAVSHTTHIAVNRTKRFMR
jgi:hypothetical protein